MRNTSTTRGRISRALATVAVAGGLAFAGAAPAMAADLSISPGGPYTNGQTVTVNGSGYLPNIPLFVVVCDPAVPAGGACDMGNFKQATTDGSGKFTTQLKLSAKFGTTDCTTKSCAVMTSRSDNPKDRTQEGKASIKFGAASTGGSSTGGSTTGGTKGGTTTAPTTAATGLVDAGNGWAGLGLLAGAGVAGAAALTLARRSREDAVDGN